MALLLAAVLTLGVGPGFAASADPGNACRWIVGEDVESGEPCGVTELDSNAAGAEQLSFRLTDEATVLVVDGVTALPPEDVSGMENAHPSYNISFYNIETKSTASVYPIMAPETTEDGRYHFHSETGLSALPDGVYRIQLFRAYYIDHATWRQPVFKNLSADILYHNAHLRLLGGEGQLLQFENVLSANRAARQDMADCDSSPSFTDPSLDEFRFAMKDPTDGASVGRALTDEEQAYIAAAAQEVAGGAQTDYEKARLLYEYLANNVYYDDNRPGNSGDNPANSNPYLNLRGIREGASNGYNITDGKAATNCVGYSALFASMARSLGIPTRIVHGTHIDNRLWTDAESINTASHHWAEFYADGRWIMADSNMGSGNHYDSETGEYTGHGLSNYTFFDPSEEQLAQNMLVKAVYLRELDDSALEITVQPLPQTVDAGEQAEMSVETNKRLDLTYCWQYSSDGGETWTDSSASRSAVIRFEAKPAFHDRLYRCVVSHGAQTVVSDAVKLTVVAPLEIVTQPAPQTVLAGEKAVFSVQANGVKLTYRWEYSRDGGETWTTSTASRGATLTTVTKTAFDGRLYRCVISDGTEEVTSEPALLTVITPLEITANPQPQTVLAGEKATFTVKATGAHLTYRWEYSKDGGQTWITSTASRGATLTTVTKTAFDGRLYRCVVSDGTAELASEPALLTVITPLAITANPQPQTVSAGEKATFRVKATGAHLKYRWEYSKDGGETWITSTASRGATLTTTVKSGFNGRLYRCVVSDGTDEIASEPALLTVTAPAASSSFCSGLFSI